MGDSEEVMAMGKKLNMNPMEQKKYKHHIQTIRYNEQKAGFWKGFNFFWQLIFFGSLFILAIATLIDNMADFNIISEARGESITKFINRWFGLIFGFLIPFSFPLMIWTGVVRSKWDGKLTRSAAYALSFLENIEHRQYLEEKHTVKPLQMRTPKK